MVLVETSRPRRMIAVALGSSGDVNPVLGVARGLVRRGHDVFVLANEVFEGPAKAVGAAFEPLGSAALYDGFVHDPGFWKWPFNVERAFKEGWVPSVRPAYDLIAALARPGETVVLASSFSLGAWLAREKLGIPFAAMHVSPLVLPSLDELPEFGPVPLLPRFLGRPGRRFFYAVSDGLVNRWLAPGVNEARKSLGLHPRKRVYQEWLHAPDRIIGVWPEWFAPPQSSWPGGTTLTGFVGYDRGNGAEALEPAVEAAFRGPPPVVVTSGSSMAHAPRFLAAASALPEALGRPVLFVTDRSFTPPPDMPAGVTHVSYLPYARVLPRAAAIVHHGGIGTGSAALRAGIPQVIAPIAYDQFDNAHRFANLGVARRLPLRRLGPRSLARELKEILESENMRTASRAYGARMDPEAAVSAACDVVESVGRTSGES